MQKFTFRLDTALRLRKLRADAETAKLQELFNHKRRFEILLSALQQERADASASIQQAPHTGAGDLRALSAFTLGLEARARTLREAIARNEVQTAEQKKRVIRAQQDELSLKKLREKRHSEWMAEAEREIENTAQELWLCSHTKNKEEPDEEFASGLQCGCQLNSIPHPGGRP